MKAKKKRKIRREEGDGNSDMRKDRCIRRELKRIRTVEDAEKLEDDYEY